MKKVLLTFAVILSFLLISCPSKTGNEPLTQFEKEKNTIYVTLKKHYAGYYDMQKRGFSKKVWKEVSNYAEEASKYEYIVLDFRSNFGGGNGEQHAFFSELLNRGYKGTIFVTQDNWSSSGEVWIIAYPFTKKLNIKLIGTHSGGMQVYGNCVAYMENGLNFWLPSSTFAADVPPNYLGEGKGYEPDIWANEDNMKSELEKLGLDLADIVFN